MSETLHYAERNIEELGELYMRHLDAMTRESLHEKGEIAAELAWRDSELMLARHRNRADRAALIAITHGVSRPPRPFTPAQKLIWDEAQDCLIAIAQAQLNREEVTPPASSPPDRRGA